MTSMSLTMVGPTREHEPRVTTLGNGSKVLAFGFYLAARSSQFTMRSQMTIDDVTEFEPQDVQRGLVSSLSCTVETNLRIVGGLQSIESFDPGLNQVRRVFGLTTAATFDASW